VQLTSRRPHTTELPPARRQPPAGRVAAAVGLALAAVFALDRWTDVAPVQHLYYAPVILAAIRFGWRGGLGTALAAVVLYHLANPGSVFYPYREGDVVQVVLFVAVGLVTARLATDARRLRRLAMTDDLTGLHNLRSFEEHLQALVVSAALAAEPLSLLVLDVDRLKTLNDEHGHLTGAEAVRTVGYTIAARAAPGAVVCRYGGDEFVVALPRCAESEARLEADRIRTAVHAVAPTLAGRAFPAGTLSVSVGVACCRFDRGGEGAAGAISPERTGEGLFRSADAALYAAKANGRNSVATGPEVAPR
jgi:diguanylate cyclase (GGDEF)-like protein